MPTVYRTSIANADLIGIALCIAEDNPAAADAWLDNFDKKCRLLVAMPEMGRLRPELERQIRSWVYGDYVIFYQISPDGIIVARVLHGSRDLPSLFAS